MSAAACLFRLRCTPVLQPRYLNSHTSSNARSTISKADVLRRNYATAAPSSSPSSAPVGEGLEPENDGASSYNRLNPSPDDYSLTPFTDRCTLSVHTGSGGHGCVSFLRDIFVPDGPANGGDGGSGGNVYIQAVRAESSLHRLARQGQVRAGRGANGQGRSKGGERGDDVIITVPVGTVVREISRFDPVEEEEAQRRQRRAEAGQGAEDPSPASGQRNKWLLYPGMLPKWFTSAYLPKVPKPRRSHLAATAPPAPISIDLDEPMEQPMLLAAGAMGGLGNPHFVSKQILRPKFATKGDGGMRLQLHLELKMLADVGLVGLPNAGKSTLLRALSNSRTRVGNWAFTTLQPNLGTVVLDNHKGRSFARSTYRSGEKRERFTVADIPGLIEGAHEDKGLGLGFLRHIERAAVLAFVIDLSAKDAVTALQGLWTEVSQYERIRDDEIAAETERRLADWRTGSSRSMGFIAGKGGDNEGPVVLDVEAGRELSPIALPPISAKPWFVVATKADLPDTRENFAKLQKYLKNVMDETEAHPASRLNAWRKRLTAVPVSGIKGEGVDKIPNVVIDLLQD